MLDSVVVTTSPNVNQNRKAQDIALVFILSFYQNSKIMLKGKNIDLCKILIFHKLQARFDHQNVTFTQTQPQILL